jgi:Xaa-Pro aminopeptidase
MPDVLIYADTVRSPELRHEVPLSIPDPFVYVERDGRRHVCVTSFEIPRLEAIGAYETTPLEELGLDELLERGLAWHELDRELVLRACRRLGVREAVTPPDFSVAVADHLRANGIELWPDGVLFSRRRRVKSGPELDGVRRAQRAAERAMDAVRAGLRAGAAVTCEELQLAALRALTEAGATAPDGVIVSHGAQTAVGHEPGHGRVSPGEPVVVDLYPRDSASGCYADMTRTFCIGEAPDELSRYHAVSLQALERARAAVRPGVRGSELHRLACDVFEAAGLPTQLSKPAGDVLDRGFYHSLGHGVGLQLHEPPYLGRGGEELVAGDVLTIEPGSYRKGFGGCRLEDLVLVTGHGCETLTDYPYDLAP